VIAAGLLLHERPIEEIVPQLALGELDKVIVLVGRSPRLYAPGTLEALKRARSSPALTPPASTPLAPELEAVGPPRAGYPSGRQASDLGFDAPQGTRRAGERVQARAAGGKAFFFH